MSDLDRLLDEYYAARHSKDRVRLDEARDAIARQGVGAGLDELRALREAVNGLAANPVMYGGAEAAYRAACWAVIKQIDARLAVRQHDPAESTLQSP